MLLLRRWPALLLVVVLTGCAAPGTDRTDEAVRLATDGLVPHDSALGHAHAVVARAAGAGEELDVLRVQEYEQDGRGELLVRVEGPGTTGLFSGRPAVLACYEVEVGREGLLDGPRRVDCPPDGAALVLPPDPARALPAGTAASLRRVLQDLPSTPSEAEVAAALRTAVPSLASKDLERPSGLLLVRGDDVGVRVFVGGGQPCLLGSRRAGVVEVRETGGGPEGCSPEAALGL